MSRWLHGAVKHPGRLTNAAKRAGVSKEVQARRWAHSSDPSKRGAGILGERFMHGDLHQKKKHAVPRAGGKR